MGTPSRRGPVTTDPKGEVWRRKTGPNNTPALAIDKFQGDPYNYMDINSYITGFTDGEGCFQVSISLRSKMKFGIEIRPSFSVSQHQRSKEIILLLQKHFNCGGVRYSKKDQNYKYEVRSIKDLIQKIIPHFENYPLLTSKKKDFEVFKEICRLVYSNQHKNSDGLKRILELSANINTYGNKKFNRQGLLKNLAR